MKTHYLFFLLLLSLLPWPLLSSSNIKFQDPVPITNFSDSSSPFNKKEDGGWLKKMSNTSPSPFADRKEKISDMSSPSKDEASENLGGSFLYDGNDDLSNTSISPTRRSLLSLPQNKQDTFLIASLNGTIYLVESDSGKVHWSFSSGTSLSSSYQAYDKNAHVLRERNGAKCIVNNDYFVECGDDWNLYMHTTRGKMKLPVTIEEFVESTPHYLEDGAIIVGEKEKIVFCVDANTGRVIRTFPAKFENDVQGILPLKQYMGDQLKSSSTNIQTTDLLFITRTNYKLESYFLDSNEVAWNMTVSDLDFQYRCSGLLEYQGDEMPFPCHIKGVVYRTREHDPLHSELRFLESHREDEMLFLPAPQTQGKETDDGKEIVPEISPEAAPFLQRNILFDPSFIVGVAFLFTVFGVVFHCGRQKRHDKSNKQSSDSSDSNRKQTSGAKKRKTRKIEHNKNNARTNDLETHISSQNKDGKVDLDPLLNLTKAIENGDGRWVGKLFVSNKEIAKGSNGTVVFEGVYDHRIQVAVKRLVLAHNDVALKEYDNLIASKQHPNIVRWFGVEQDSDFFYLPLERCTCNLNDLIGLYSDAFPNSLSTENPASYNVNEYKVQLKSIKGIDKDTDLWQVNGYPSSKLLNLMRDVVAGLAHLHELGIIHRDLKPQNVLITCEKSLCAKLSDMGISKRLNEGMSSLGHHATGYGSSGWQAPEQILHGRQTRAVDLFSLGCVLFFCITKGKHPFGECLERDSNIVKNRFDLFLVEHIPEAVDLFSQLLHPKPEKRPKAKEVLHHPFFFEESEAVTQFLREGKSDRYIYGHSQVLTHAIRHGPPSGCRYTCPKGLDQLQDSNVAGTLDMLLLYGLFGSVFYIPEGSDVAVLGKEKVAEVSSTNSIMATENWVGSPRDEEDRFEQVSLKDQEGSVLGPEGNLESPTVSKSDNVSPAAELAVGKTVAELDGAIAADMHESPHASMGLENLSDRDIKPSLSLGSPDSSRGFTGETVISSPFASPQKPKTKPSMPNVSPELLHSVDSAITGEPSGLENLRGVVSCNNKPAQDKEAVDIAFMVVDALLVKMGGVECIDDSEGSNPPNVMLNSRAAVVAAELIPWLPWEGGSEGQMSPRTKMVKGLLAVLRACTRNRSMCTAADLLGVLLWSAEKIFAQEVDSTNQILWDHTPLCHCIQVLATHSLNVVDLDRWLQAITRSLPTVWSTDLMLALEKAMGGMETRGPACTFEFDGESSGLLGPGESRWPFSNGYAFATWIYIESFADTLNTATAAAAIAAAAAAKSGKSSAMSAAAAASALAGEGTAHMPRLFSFLSADNQGFEAYFHAQFLVVESGSGKGKKASLHFTHAFKPQCWYFVGLEHTCKQGLLGKAESELRLYVDGTLYESRPFEFPRISKPLAFCCIGTNPPPTMAGLQRRRRQCPLFAEMGPIYIFKEPLGPDRMARLAARGGDVLPSFGNGAGLPWLATNDHMRNLAVESFLLDADIGGSLHLLYHPNLLNGRFCPDASPSGQAGTHRRPAEVLGQVHLASRIRPAESLWALAYGGPMSLLPLAVSDVQNDSLEPEPGDFPLSLATASLSASIFRIISMAIQHPGNNEELCRARGPEVLSIILRYLLRALSTLDLGQQNGVRNEEVVASIVSLCQSQRNNHLLKVQLFRTLLLDLKIWSLCNYGLQKKLLSSLADMVFTESAAMRGANAVQMLLDGCRRCYWVVREMNSVDTFSLNEASRPVGEVNALVDELLVVIELLVGAASPSLAVEDVHCLIGFMVDCPQPNQVARVLHLMYRLVVQPNTFRAHTFADSFISCGGVETLLVLLQREAKAGNDSIDESSGGKVAENVSIESSVHETNKSKEKSHDDHVESLGEKEYVSHEEGSQLQSSSTGDSSIIVSAGTNIGRTPSSSENQLIRNLGGISFSITADSARSNVYNVDNGDGIVVGIIHLLGALLTSGHLKFSSNVASLHLPSNLLSNGLPDEGSAMFYDKISLVLFALQKAFQAAPQRLMTYNVYMALLGAAINAPSTDDGLNFYDSGHRFEHAQLLLVLLRSLPHASRAFQARAIQDLLFLACSHPENRSSLTSMEEWPEWILEVLISNYEVGPTKCSNGGSIGDIEDLIHNFLIIMLEHSMRQKDGWKDIEATIHCAEWLSMIGGSSTGDQRVRREESLPVFKRRLLGGLLDFAARELQVQTQIIAAAAAGVAAEGLSPEDAKAEAESAAQLSVALAENALVILMLVEDHLRLQSQLFCASLPVDSSGSPASSTGGSRSNSLSRTGSESLESVTSRRFSLSSDSGGLSLDVLASMADANGQISAAVMERLTAAAAAEPYEHVRCALVSYGSCVLDLAEGWKYRSRMWYGVGLSPKTAAFSGGGSGWDCWNSALEKDSNGFWIELPLVKKSVTMLEALLLDECGLGGGLGIGGGSGTGMGGMTALYQLLDSDQPFLCMLRMVLASMREEDSGEDVILKRNLSITDGVSEASHGQAGNMIPLDNNSRLSTRNNRSALLWSVLAPVLNMPVSESKRQRVLAASCVLYAEVWHAVGKDRKPLRRQYLEAILPPFVAILRRWRPLLAAIHELTSSDGLNPLVADDRALAADALPLESALAMISPGWAAAFASPPAAMALAMIAAGAAGTETVTPARNTQIRRDSSLAERKTPRLQTFASFQKPSDLPNISSAVPKDKAAAKAAALAAARDLERNAKIGSGRGLSAVAMATSAQRRSKSDLERVRRWNVSEAMGCAWIECLQSIEAKSVSGKDFSALSHKYVAVLVASFALARNMQRMEMDRRAQVDVIDRHSACTGIHAWCRLIHCLIEIKCLYGPFGDRLCNPEHVFWKLDFAEGSLRMRRCLRRNYKGSDHLGAAANYEDHNLQLQPDEENTTSQTNDPEASFRSGLPSAPLVMAEAISLEERNEDDEQIETETDNFVDRGHDMEQSGENEQRLSATVEKPVRASLDNKESEVVNGQRLDQNASAVAPGYVPSESDERIILELSSLMVRPLRVIRGTFQITTKRINFIVGEHNNDNLIEDALHSNSQSRETEKDRSWFISCLHQMFSRRYLLRRSALELFMVDRSNYFFDFGSTESRKNVYRAIVQVQPPYLNNIYLATQRPEQLLKRTQLMERWARWEISNFEYLMQLNTLAGRSYNDITQYPVFPWILADYSSKNLDLGDPSSYRDLSKPVGALNPDRLVKFQERYSSFDDPIIPKFHYGSHYSSAGTVLYYLTRMEPFTTLSIQLQGGKFDHADRMFSNIGGTWNSVLEDMSDVKELVPELFYLPEVLTNVNSIDFGTTQLGGKIDSVKLPPWADNPVDFIHKHHKALESEHVSAHLHEWIDLIFGYKQRGKEAILANNVFFYITYEGTVDIDKISDPVQQRSTQDQIAYFGQTPSQLLTVPHMKRRPLADVLHLQTIFRNPNEVRPYVVPNPERCNLPAAAIFVSQDSVVVVDENAPAAHVALHKWQPTTPDGHGTPFLFQHGKTVASSTGGAFMRMFKGPAGSGLEEWQFPRALAFATSGIRSSAVVAVTCDKEIITGGHADNSVKLISSDGAKTIETAVAHFAPVTCLSLSPDSNYLVTGSRDTTVILWRMHRAILTRSSSISEPSTNSAIPSTGSPLASGNSNNFAENSRRRRIEGPVHVLRGHLKEILCCCVNSDVGVVVSSSLSSGVLLHSVRRGRLIRKLTAVEAHALCLSSKGVILTWNKFEQKLRTFTINGVPVATAVLSPFLGSVSCIEVSVDGESVLIGMNSCSIDKSAENGGRRESESDKSETKDLTMVLHEENVNRLAVPVPSVSFLDLHTLKILHTLELGEGQDITALALNKDNTNLLVSTADKQLIVFTDPALSLKVVDQMLRLGWEGDGLSPLIK